MQLLAPLRKLNIVTPSDNRTTIHERYGTTYILVAVGDGQVLDDASHEGGGAERGVRLPRDVLRAVQVVTDAAYEHKAVLAVATYRLDDLIELGIHGDALVTQREVLTQHVVLDYGLAGANGAVTQYGLALAMPRLHLSNVNLTSVT